MAVAMAAEQAERDAREKMVDMSNPGAKFFGQHKISIDVWVDPTRTDAALDAVLDNVQIAACNAVEEAMKAIDAPDLGVEVVVR